MSSLLGGLTGAGSGTASVNTATSLTATLGQQPAAPATSSSGAMPPTGSNVTVPAASATQVGVGAPYGGLQGTLVAASYGTNGVPLAAQIYFPALGYTATFLASSITVQAS